MADGLARWANPSSPHAAGRAARAAVEDARRRIAAALDWPHALIFTSGASEALSIALTRSMVARVLIASVEHDAVLRAAPAARLGGPGLDDRGSAGGSGRPIYAGISWGFGEGERRS